MISPEFYRGKRVLITGHTGFKGTWLCRVLLNMGAQITGYSLMPPTNPNLFSLAGIQSNINSIIGDVRDLNSLKEVFLATQPELVLHLAAQPLVRDSYQNPHYTYETNVMGTVNVLECIRQCRSVKSFLNVTTDKVYLNREWVWGYREDEALDGFDPYSNSKSCSEIITHSYKNSFFHDNSVAISTARAGNVIGGGDFSANRIIPDCIRAQIGKKEIVVRNPNSVRPYQHVLEPIMAYLMITEKQYENKNYSGWYNVGPDDSDCVTTGELVNMFCKTWGNNASWRSNKEANAPHEANFLRLDCSKLKNTFNWKPRWHIQQAVEKTCEWAKVWMDEGDIPMLMDHQIAAYMES